MMDYKQLIEKDCREYRELLRMREEITAEMEAFSDKIKAAMGDHEMVFIAVLLFPLMILFDCVKKNK